jgi:purine-binding chemotaxis protein CheW
MASVERHEDGSQFVTLGLDREVFAVGVEAVIEILDARPLARVPNAPAFFAGLIDVRGRSVPVVDLRLKLGLPPAPTTHHTRIVVLEVERAEGRGVFGLQADRVFEVTGLDERQMEAPPEIGVRWRSDYIKGIGRSNGAFVIVFDLERLLSGEELALLSGGEAAP